MNGEEVPLRNAMNEVLRDAYIEDCQKCLDRWNRVIAEHGIPFELRLPDRRFHRHIGVYAGRRCDPRGRPVSDDAEFLPSAADRAYVKNLNMPHLAVGEISNWIARPTHGIKGLPFEFEYVRREP